MVANLTRKIALNTAVQSIGKVAITILAVVSVAILTRYLGAEGYGKLTIALVYLSFFGIFADLGLFTIVVREISKDESRSREIVGNALSLRTLLSVVVMLLAIGLAAVLPYEPDVKVAVAIASAAIFFGLLNSSLITVFQARLAMGYSVVADIAGRAASLTAVIVAASLDLGFFAIVATAAVGSLVTFLVTNYFVRRFVKIGFLGDRRLWKELFRESLPLGAALAINQIYFRVDTVILSLLRSPAEVGIYGAAYKVLEILITFPGFFINSVFPVLSKYVAEGDRRVRETVQRSFDVLWLVSAPVVVGGIVIGPALMRTLTGAGFDESGLALQLLLPSVVFSFAVGIFAYSLIAKKKQAILFKVSLALLTGNVLLNLALIPSFGFKAAAIITTLTEAAAFVVLLLLFRRHYGFAPGWGRALRALAAAGVMGAVLYAAQDVAGLPVIANLVIGGLAYAGAAMALRATTVGELKTVVR